MKKLFAVAALGMLSACSFLNTSSPNETIYPNYAKYRTAYNYCTYGYTFSYWTWEEWKTEIDRLSDNGVNQVLVLPGHEKVWQNTLRRLGMSDSDITAFIPAPPFAPWWLMGNLEGLGGPINQSTIDYQAELGRKMVERMRAKGMEPIVNGFVGIVPTTLHKYIAKDAKIIPQGRWAGGCQRPAVLSPLDPEFDRIAQIWYEEVKNVYGEVNYFGGDLFHEGGHSGGLSLAKCAEALQKSMLKANPNAIYILQGWGGNPSDALLSGLDSSKIVVQSLVKDMYNMGGKGDKKQPFNGAPWTFALVNNFGGNHGIYGNLHSMATFQERLAQRVDTTNFEGFAMLDEGFERNAVNEALWYEMMKSNQKIDLKKFLVNYTQDRYGVDGSDIFMYLSEPNCVYGVQFEQEGVTDFCIGTAPSNQKSKARYWCAGRQYWNLKEMVTATDSLLALDAKGADYDYDLVDFERQILDRYALHVRNEMVKAFNAKDLNQFNALFKTFMEVFDDLADLCATHPAFLADCQAEKFAKITGDATTHKRALNLLHTTWVERYNTDLNDYASRTNEFIVREYYKKRWKAWGEHLQAQLENKKPTPVDYYAITQAYIQSNNVKRPSSSSTKEVATRIHQKYKKFIEKM